MALRSVHSNPEVLEHAIHDGINEFIREVLVPEGFVRASRLANLTDQEVSRMKLIIAKSVDAKWTTCEIESE